MPPDTSVSDSVLTGRCYCGAFSLSANEKPHTVAYCHCADCRRVTGAPLTAFASFAPDALKSEPPLPTPVSFKEGVQRWFCPHCGSPLAATYSYLPSQLWVPVALFDQVDQLAPESHSHAASRIPWLHLADDLPRSDGSGRDHLNAARTP